MKEPYLQLSSIGKIQVNRYLARQVFIVRTCGLLSPVNRSPDGFAFSSFTRNP